MPAISKTQKILQIFKNYAAKLKLIETEKNQIISEMQNEQQAQELQKIREKINSL